ncbi:MAG: alpha/beta hydrolase [Pseudomonadota bacterium]
MLSKRTRRILGYSAAGLTAFALLPRLLADRLLYFPERRYDSRPEMYRIPYEEVRLTTEDGVKLHAWWTGEPSQKTTVLFFHGNAGNISHRLERILTLHSLKVRFFLLGYRGYGESEGKPKEDGLYRDATAAYRYLMDHGVPAKNLYLFGESLGGAVAIELATRLPVAGLILESTFTSVREMAWLHYPFFPSLIVPDQFPSLARIPKIRSKFLIVHGNHDEIAPFSMGERLFAAANEPKSFFPVPGAGHNDVYVVSGRAYIDRIANFLENR